MRLKVAMINALGKLYDEIEMENSEREAKINLQSLNPKSKILNGYIKKF